MIIEPILIITNNPMSKEEFNKKYDVEFVEGNTLAVYAKVRDYIHKGHRLLTHPLMSSIKPNETPYRTIIISKKADLGVDFQSLNLIEEATHTTEKFLGKFGWAKWRESVLEDFQVIDCDLISHAIR